MTEALFFLYCHFFKLEYEQRRVVFSLTDKYTGGRKFASVVVTVRNGLFGGDIIKFLRLESVSVQLKTGLNPHYSELMANLEELGWKFGKTENMLLDTIKNQLYLVSAE